VIYAGDRGSYPSTITVMRTAGYLNVGESDPWTVNYQMAPALATSQVPAIQDDIYIFSKGASQTGTYPVPFVSDTGLSGSVGYSSVYGAWTGR
jgi:hypothetical protein